MGTLTLVGIGNSTGVVIPKELLQKLGVEKGDQLHYTETERGIELTPFDPEFERRMALARKLIVRHRDMLRALASIDDE